MIPFVHWQNENCKNHECVLYCNITDLLYKIRHWLVHILDYYCVQAWLPHLEKDIDLIETEGAEESNGVSVSPSFGERSCGERLKVCNLATIETRRLRGDIIDASSRSVIKTHASFAAKESSRNRKKKNIFSDKKNP